ncbi:hypothetical protein B0H17DRAFT_1330573 [Mycena rosella]|uniref:Uncharacterized protein n=1 Tax=Mycena rosella TaxID=1033263 RepID=A0AAD7DJU8_MYCRO|nr:hypothetical protein B0H17DRAFT_1330573 [Mycena rosella]
MGSARVVIALDFVLQGTPASYSLTFRPSLRGVRSASCLSSALSSARLSPDAVTCVRGMVFNDSPHTLLFPRSDPAALRAARLPPPCLCLDGPFAFTPSAGGIQGHAILIPICMRIRRLPRCQRRSRVVVSIREAAPVPRIVRAYLDSNRSIVRSRLVRLRFASDSVWAPSLRLWIGVGRDVPVLY